MNHQDFICLTPLMIIAAVPIIMMLVVAFTRQLGFIYGLAVAGFILALFSVIQFESFQPHTISTLFIFDGFSIVFFVVILTISLLITIMSYRYLRYQGSEKEEFFIMLNTAVLGSLILAAAGSFVTLFLGIEILSISLYVLVAYRRSRDEGVEAAVKYLILASVSSAFLVFGMALIYMDTGSLEFTTIARVLEPVNYSTPLLLTGFAMMMVGIGFKLALVPFHMWTPDVYQGAPVPITTFIATVSKGAVMAFLLRFFYEIRGFSNPGFIIMITAIALLSMFAGNLLAIRQQNVKRILAYSSISNMGYLIVTLLVGTSEGTLAGIFYIVSYMVTTLAAFGVIIMVADHDNDAGDLENYKGLFWKRPFIAIVFTLSLLSLAGIPLTTGFIAKFYIVFAGIHTSLWVLVGGLILNSVIGLYYYLRVITTLYSPVNDIPVAAPVLSEKLVMGFTALAILWLGLAPSGFLQYITRMLGQ